MKRQWCKESEAQIITNLRITKNKHESFHERNSFDLFIFIFTYFSELLDS